MIVADRRSSLLPPDVLATLQAGANLRPPDPHSTIHRMLEQAARLMKPTADSADLSVYPSDPVEFIEIVLDTKLWQKQQEIARSVWANRFTAVASCHGIGKTYLAARLALAWLHTKRNSIVITTGPSGEQVKNVMWRNIRSAAREAPSVPGLIGRSLVQRYEINDDWYGVGYKASKDNLAAFQGFHAEDVLLIIDESPGVSDEIIDTLRGAMTAMGARMLLLGNPTSTGGRFFQAFHSNREDWATFQIPFSETPNFKAPPESPPMPKLITHGWVDEQIKTFGKDSAFVKARVDAQFVAAKDALITLQQILDANNRDAKDLPPTEPWEAGLDVARYGDDRCVLWIRAGGRTMHVEAWGYSAIDETAARAMSILRQSKWRRVSLLKVDVIGMGSGVVDIIRTQLREERESGRDVTLRCLGINVSMQANDPEKHPDQRNEGYAVVAERYRDGHMAGQIPDEAVAELSDILYRFSGRYTQPVIEPKADFKKRRGRSPDYADACMLAFYTPRKTDQPKKGPGVIAQGQANIYGTRKPLLGSSAKRKS